MLFFISPPTLPTVASVSVNQLNVKSVLRETSFDPQTTGIAASFIGGCGGDDGRAAEVDRYIQSSDLISSVLLN